MSVVQERMRIYTERTRDLRGDALFDPDVESLENGLAADYLLLALAALQSAERYFNMAERAAP